jgi:nucleoside 2-deoxyribosyltransferase
MTKPTVYLAGPISGESFAGASDWRDFATERLATAGIIALSPLRHKTYLAEEKSIQDSYSEFALSTAQAITARDRFDVQRCDVVLMYLVGAKKVSIGTMIEAGWADAFRKPVVLVLEDPTQKVLHEHERLTTICGFRATNLWHGIDIAVSIIGPCEGNRT